MGVGHGWLNTKYVVGAKYGICCSLFFLIGYAKLDGNLKGESLYRVWSSTSVETQALLSYETTHENIPNLLHPYEI